MYFYFTAMLDCRPFRSHLPTPTNCISCRVIHLSKPVGRVLRHAKGQQETVKALRCDDVRTRMLACEEVMGREGGNLRGGCGSLKEARAPVGGLASDHDYVIVVTYETLQSRIFIHRRCEKWIEGQYLFFELTISSFASFGFTIAFGGAIRHSMSERIPRPHHIRTGLITFPASISATASLAALTGYWRSNLSMGNLP